MVTLTLITTAGSGARDCAAASRGSAIVPSSSDAVRANLRIAFCIACLHHHGLGSRTRSSHHCSAASFANFGFECRTDIQYSCHAARTLAKASACRALDVRGEPWRSGIRSSSSAAGRSASRSPSSSGCAASPARWSRRRTGAAADPQGAEPHPAHARALLFLGHRRRAAGRAPHAARLSDRRGHRLRQPDERVLARAGRPRAACAPTTSRTTSGCRSTGWRGAARARWRRLPSVESALRLDGARRSSRTTTACASRSSRRRRRAREILEADYLVGCDGGHSLVREQVGIERGGTDFDQLMVLAVFRSRELHEGLKRFPGALDLPRHASRT